MVSASRPSEGEKEQVEGVVVTHHYLDNKGMKIHYVEAGNPKGQPVLLIHGWPEFWYSWAFQFAALENAGYHVFAMDLRGFNHSDRPAKVDQYGEAYVLDDIKEVVLKLGSGKSVNVVAHDWGGICAWGFVWSYPELVSKLVQLNISHPAVWMDAVMKFGNLMQVVRSWYIVVFTVPWLSEWLLRFNNFAWLRHILTGKKQQTEGFMERHVDAQRQDGALTAGLNYYRAIKKFWKSEDKEVTQPVKIIWGVRDRYIGQELAYPPTRWVPNQEVKFVPEASHWVHWDEPEVVNQEILKFLSA